ASAGLGAGRWRGQHGIRRMAFAPGGQSLATTGAGVLSVWDVDAGRVVRTISTDGTPRGDGFWGDFAFTPDGKLLLSADAVGDRKSRLLLWEFSSGKVLAQSDLDGAAGCLVLRPDGRMAACATDLGDVFLWDLEKDVIRRAVSGDGRRAIHGLSFAGEGKHLVVLPDEGGVSQRIEVASGALVKEMELGSQGRVALAPGGGTVGAYSHPDLLYLYDTSTGDKRRLP